MNKFFLPLVCLSVAACSPVSTALYSRNASVVQVGDRAFTVNRMPDTENTWVAALSETQNRDFKRYEYLLQAAERIEAIEIFTGCVVGERSVSHVNNVVTIAEVNCKPSGT